MLELSDTPASILRVIWWTQTAPHLVARAIRYALVGIGNGLIFAIISVVAISLLDIPATAGSGLGYLCSVPLSFIGHRGFTFQSHGPWRGEAGRFLAIHLCSLTATVMIVRTVTVSHLPYYLGLLGAVLLVPIVNFLVANFWVFAKSWKGE
jgi:putative flippase GtrA